MKESELWERCRTYPLPTGPDGQDFTTWLSEEEGLSKGQANELVLEYRRCVYLAASGAAEPPIAPKAIASVRALHVTSGDLPKFREDVLGGAPLPSFGRPDKRSLAGLVAAYEMEFGKTPNPRIWTHTSRRWYWVAAALLFGAGAAGALVEGTPMLLALGGIPAALLVVFLLTEGRMAGADGLTDAARYGGGMGGGGGVN